MSNCLRLDTHRCQEKTCLHQAAMLACGPPTLLYGLSFSECSLVCCNSNSCDSQSNLRAIQGGCLIMTILCFTYLLMRLFYCIPICPPFSFPLTQVFTPLSPADGVNNILGTFPLFSPTRRTIRGENVSLLFTCSEL